MISPTASKFAGRSSNPYRQPHKIDPLIVSRLDTVAQSTKPQQSCPRDKSLCERGNSSPTASSPASRWFCKSNAPLGIAAPFWVTTNNATTATSCTPTAPTYPKMSSAANLPKSTNPQKTRSTSSACAHNTAVASQRVLLSSTTQLKR